MKRHICFLLSLALFESAAQAQVAPFLASAWKSSSVTLQEQNRRQFGNTGFINPIDGLQVRLTPKETPAENEIAFRIMPRGWSEYQLMKQLSIQETSLEQINARSALAQALEARYTALVEYAYAVERKRLLASLIEVQQREASIFQRASRSALADVDSLLKAQNDFEESQLDFLEAENLVKVAFLKIKSLDPSVSEKDLKSLTLPAPQDLLSLVSRLEQKIRNVEDLSTVQLLQERSVQARRSLSLSLAEDERLIDFVELSASENKMEKYYGFQISFNIPGFASSDYSFQQKARELVKYDVEAQSALKSQALLLETQRENLKKFAELHKVVFSSHYPGEEKLKKLARQQDPLLALSIEKRRIDRFLRAHDIAFEAQKTYVSFLLGADILFHEPQLNYLSKDLKAIRE